MADDQGTPLPPYEKLFSPNKMYQYYFNIM